MQPNIMDGQRILIRKVSTNNLQRNNIIAFYNPNKSDLKLSKKPVLISRLIGLPGDTVTIEKKEIFVNGNLFNTENDLWFHYRVSTNSTFNRLSFDSLCIFQPSEIVEGLAWKVICSPKTAAKIIRIEGVSTVRLMWDLRNQSPHIIFPYSQYIAWNKDYYGPVIIPQKGMTVQITYRNVDLYKQIINIYEGHEVHVNLQRIFIDDKETSSYTFEKNYYFVIDDNRDFFNDSRTLGFIPRNHIIGKK
jgi:signal peptidase I